jgi:hypothetical protein
VTELVVFDYGQLDVETRIVVRQRTDEIKTLVRKSAQDIIDIGNKLIEVKTQLGHGNFGAWLDGEFGWSESTALRFMHVGQQFKSITVTDLNIQAKALYLLAAPSTPEPARLEAVQRAEAGEAITHSTAKAIVAQHKPQPVLQSTPPREYAAAVPSIREELGVPTLDRALDAMDEEIAAIVEPEPAAPAPSRPLTDEEAAAVVWRVIGRLVPQHEGESQYELAHRRVNWLRKATFSHFIDAIKPGVIFTYSHYARIVNEIDSQLMAQAKRPAPTINKPQPTPSIVEPATPVAGDEEPQPEEEKADSDEYYTPPYIAEAARQVLGKIDLDPASCALAQRVIKANVFINKANNSLDKRYPWLGRVWLNPPFSNPAPFIAKLIDEYDAGRIKAAIVLVNNGTETQWGQSLLRRYPVCFVGAHDGKGSRLAFWRTDPDEPRTSNRYAQMIFYLGPKVETFREVFSQFGVIKT